MNVPSPSSGRGEVVLQPAYFTSSAFVHPARADVDRLVHEYARQDPPTSPFTLFKHVWQNHGWTWIHLTVFDARSRAAFLGVILRLFLERIRADDPPLVRAAALFGLYTIYLTQPSSLYSVARVHVSCDLYRDMCMLPDVFDGDSIRPHVIYVLSSLLQTHVFHILPHAETLPRQVVTTTGRRRKRGRPCKRDKLQKAQDALTALDEWCDSESGPSASDYVSSKSSLVSALCRDERWMLALRAANETVAVRIAMVKNNKENKEK